MKKQKLSLNQLKVESFVTSKDKIRGGSGLASFPFCNPIPTQHCPTGDPITGEGLGICAADKTN